MRVEVEPLANHCQSRGQDARERMKTWTIAVSWSFTLPMDSDPSKLIKQLAPPIVEVDSNFAFNLRQELGCQPSTNDKWLPRE